ncbi:MAG: MerR family DNA-binding transcriptional regulator [Microgenomates group bacterium]|jgi:hypothetical protein
MKDLPNKQTKKFVKIGEASVKLGVSIDTLRRWEKAGKIEITRTPGGTRLYSISTISKLTEIPKKYQRKTVDYPRVPVIEPAKIKVTTVEDLLNLSRQETEKHRQTPSTDQKWQEYVDERTVNPVEVTILSESELPQAVAENHSSKAIKTSFLGNKIYKLTATAFTGTLIMIILAFLVLARTSNFNIFNTAKNNQLSTASQSSSTLPSNVLATSTSGWYLDFDSDVIIEGDLAVGGSINKLTLAPNADGFSISGGDTANRKMTVIGGDVTLDQDVSTNGSPSFQALDLPATSKQITMGGAGTLTWTPTGTQTITFPNATGTVLLDSATQTITNKTISGGSNTLSAIPNSALSNNKITISAGTNLSGGGDISLGSSGTLSLEDDISLSTVTATSYLSLGQTSAPSTATDKLYNIAGSLYWNGTDLSASGGSVPSVNGLIGALTIAGGGINSVSALGTTITITGTEADTLASVTARGATTTDAVTFSSTINSNTFTSTALTFAGASPAISASTGGTSIFLDAGTSGKVVIAGTSTGDVDIAGGSGTTGCTIVNATGDLSCSGNISGGSTGTAGFWGRAGTTLSPATAGDNITTTGAISTTGTGTLSIAGAATFSSTINSNTFTSTALTFAGTTPIVSASTAATDISLNPGAGGNVQLAGGSASFGCTINDTTGDLTCTGAIASGGTGVVGYWQTDGGSPPTLSPATTGGHITTSGNMYTSGTGTITSGGLLTGQTGLTVSGGAISLNASSNYDTNINTGTSTGAISIGNSAAGAISMQSGAASTFAAPANTATAFRFTDGTNAYLNLDTRNTLSGVSALTLSAGTAPTITSASNAEFTTLTTTPPTITLTGTTQVTSQMDSILFNAPTITDSSALTVDKAASVSIAGAPVSGATGLVTLTDSYALKVNTASVDGGTGTVTNSFGISVDAPTGATNNYAATFNGGNVGIGTTAPTALLSVGATSQFQVNSSGAIAASTGISNSGGYTQSGTTANTFTGTSTFSNATYSAFFTGGNVGIGTTAPIGRLDVTDTSNTAASLSLTNNTATTIGNGANTLGVIDLQSTSLTTGNFLNVELNALSSGKGFNLTSTSTALSSGSLASLDWSPTGSTTIYATGDLFSINAGQYGSVGNFFNIKDNGTSVFSISQQALTTSLPAAFNAPGDVSIAYDINFTNPTASYLKSQAPLYITPGEIFNSSDLVLSTYNQGSIILSKDFTSTAAVTNYLSQINGSDVTAIANTNYGLYSSITHTGNAAKTGVGLYSTLSTSSTTADTLIASDLATSTSGIMTTGTRNIYGLRSQPASTGASTGGTTNVYGGYLKSGGTVGVGGTINSYGMYIANGTMSTTGLSTNTGLYVESPTGADNNYAAIFAGGNVGIGTTAPAALFSVGSTSQFQVSSAGAVTAVGLNSGSGLLQGTGGLTLTGTTLLNTTGTAATSIGNSTGILTLASGGTSAWTNTSGNLTISTATSGILALTSAGALNLTSGAASTWTLPATTVNALNIGSNLLTFDTQNSRIGIGTTAPGANLDVAGNIMLSDGNNDAITFNNSYVQIYRNASMMQFNAYTGWAFYDTQGSAERVRITNAGDVGIGITAPIEVSAGRTYLSIKGSTGAGALELSTAQADADAVTNGVIQFTDVNSTATDKRTAIIQSYLSGATGNNRGGRLVFKTKPDGVDSLPDRLTIEQNGNVGIGTTAPARSLETTGSIRMGPLITGGGSAVAMYRDANGDLADSTSSIKFKTDLTAYPSVLEKVLQLNAVNFKWNELTPTPGANDFGMIAEQVNTIIPDLVIYDADGVTPHGLKYDKMGFVALKAIQELNTKVNSFNLTFDENGNVILPKVKIDQLVLSSDIPVNGQQQNYFDVAGKIAEQNAALSTQSTELAKTQSQLDVLSASVSSASANLSSASAEIASAREQISSTSSSLASLREEIEGLKLTPPEVLLSTVSAQLTDLNVTSEATFSGKLTAYEATISDTFKSLGNSFLGNTTIAGDFSIDGTLSLTGSSLSTIDTLYVQNKPLAGDVDFFNGQVIIDKTGKLTAQKIVLPSEVLGEATIPANTVEIPIFTTAVTGKSKIFLTPSSSTGGQAVILGEVLPGTGFVAKLDHSISADIKLNWVIFDQQ